MEIFSKIDLNAPIFALIVIIIYCFILHRIRKRKDALLREHDRILEEQYKKGQENISFLIKKDRHNSSNCITLFKTKGFNDLYTVTNENLSRMEKIKAYIINNLFKIEYVMTKSKWFPLGMDIKCGKVELGSWKTTDNIDTYPDSINKWKQTITLKAELSQIKQFNAAYPNNTKLLIGFVSLKLKNTIKSLINKFSKVS